MSSAEQAQTSSEPATVISRVAVKAPPFWKHNPALWFLQLEAQFELSGKTVDNTKFHHVVAAIETDIFAQISDIVATPPESNRYESLKTRLIQHFATSAEKRFRQLLSGIELGDCHPSHLLREMREHSAGTVGDDFLQSLWLQRLPTPVQQILAASSEQLSQLALLADKILEVTDSSVNALSQDETIRRLEVKVDVLTKQLNNLAQRFRRRSTS